MGVQVIVYVKSVKTLTGTNKFERRTYGRDVLGDGNYRIELEGKITRGTLVMKTYRTETQLVYEFVLPEEQQIIVDLTKEIASKLGLEVKVIDVGKENVLHRAIQKEFEKIRLFPTLVSDSSMMLEGTSTKEQIEVFLARAKKRLERVPPSNQLQN